MKIFIIALFLLSYGLQASAEIPRWWHTNIKRAKSNAAAAKKPLIVLFAENGVADVASGFDKIPGLRQLLLSHCVPLHVKLPPARYWNGAFQRRMSGDFPFLRSKFQEGFPLPAVFFVSADGNDLKVAEPPLNLAGYEKAVKESISRLSRYNEAQADAAHRAEAERRRLERWRQEEKKILAEERTERAPEPQRNAAQPDTPKYSAAAQREEAARQRRANRDRKGDPPEGWFTDPEKAKEFAAARKLPIMWLFSGTDWCPPCRALRRNVLDKKSVQRLVTEKCVAVYVHVGSGQWRQIKSRFPFWKSNGVPSFVFTDAQLNVLKSAPQRIQRSQRGLEQAIKDAGRDLK